MHIHIYIYIYIYANLLCIVSMSTDDPRRESRETRVLGGLTRHGKHNLDVCIYIYIYIYTYDNDQNVSTTNAKYHISRLFSPHVW